MFTVDTYISESIGKGLGVYAVNYIPKDTIVWEYIEGIDLKIHVSKISKLNSTQLKCINKYFWKEGDQNHSGNANIVVYNNNLDIPCSERPMITIRDIQPNEELLVNYSEFDDDYELYKNELIH